MTTLQDDNASAIEEETDAEALDSLGIPGWGRVDKLARALIALEGLSDSKKDGVTIKQLYNNLFDYDKRPLTFKQRVMRPAKGKFARKKYRVGDYTTVEAVKRYVNITH